MTLNLGNYPASGERYTPCTIYWSYDPNSPTNEDKYDVLTPKYSCSDGGVIILLLLVVVQQQGILLL